MDANDLLMRGGVKTASFPDLRYGTTVAGPIIAEPAVTQQKDFDTDKPKFYDDGNPMLQVVVHVRTDQRDPAVSHDDGTRAIYVKGQMLAAVREAIRAAGCDGIAKGGWLSVTYVRDEPNSRGKGHDKKVFNAVYRGPAVTLPAGPTTGNGSGAQGVTAYLGSPDPGAAYTPPPTRPVVEVATSAPVPPSTVPDQPAPAGIDPGLWAALTADQKAAILRAQTTGAVPAY